MKKILKLMCLFLVVSLVFKISKITDLTNTIITESEKIEENSFEIILNEIELIF